MLSGFKHGWKLGAISKATKLRVPLDPSKWCSSENIHVSWYIKKIVIQSEVVRLELSEFGPFDMEWYIYIYTYIYIYIYIID